MPTNIVVPRRAEDVLEEETNNFTQPWQLFQEEVALHINNLQNVPPVVIPPPPVDILEEFSGVVVGNNSTVVVHTATRVGFVAKILLNIAFVSGNRRTGLEVSAVVDGSGVTCWSRRMQNLGDDIDFQVSISNSLGIFEITINNDEIIDLTVGGILTII